MSHQCKMLSVAIALSARVFENVMDKGGQPYILHKIRVMNSMPEDDFELRQIAVMHDVVEDTDITFEDLIKMGFSARVVDALVLLTHLPQDSYELYIKEIKKNPDARQVKKADIEDNSKVSRLKGVREKDIERMVKYNRAYLYLTDKMSEYEYLNKFNK